MEVVGQFQFVKRPDLFEQIRESCAQALEVLRNQEKVEAKHFADARRIALEVVLEEVPKAIEKGIPEIGVQFTSTAVRTIRGEGSLPAEYSRELIESLAYRRLWDFAEKEGLSPRLIHLAPRPVLWEIGTYAMAGYDFAVEKHREQVNGPFVILLKLEGMEQEPRAFSRRVQEFSEALAQAAVEEARRFAEALEVVAALAESLRKGDREGLAVLNLFTADITQFETAIHEGLPASPATVRFDSVAHQCLWDLCTQLGLSPHVALTSPGAFDLAKATIHPEPAEQKDVVIKIHIPRTASK